MSLQFVPLLPVWAVVLVCAILGLALWRARGVSRLRGIGWVCVVLALLGPRMMVETREPVRDVALVLVDDSQSQEFGQRKSRTAQALTNLQSRLAQFPDLDVRIQHVGGDAPLSEGTRLIQALALSLADIPKQRLSGVFLITDGLVHDASPQNIGAPIHALLSGDHNEMDRRVEVLGTPDFALVGKDARLRFRISGEQKELPVKIDVDGVTFIEQSMPTDRELTVDIPIHHAGQTVVDIGVAAGPNELTLTNNHAIVGLSGIRDRLKVLLLSGVPHVGERVWRNLLKADPAVDLVHFTILRSAEKADPTPLNELSLISFPVKELFEQRLPDFDLVILDRYRGGELPRGYLARLASYVKEGGALLVAAGPEFTDTIGLAGSPLAEVLPALPQGTPINAPVRPTLSADGKRHPVTAEMARQQEDWGRWLRYIPTAVTSGTALLQTPKGDPLVVLSHMEEGRVAEILSDTGWLWARGWENGGPYRELLRRMAHWLMKEPDLEEEALTAHIQSGMLQITRRSLSPEVPDVTVTAPDGQTSTVHLVDKGDGTETAQLSITTSGLWRVSDGTKTAIAVDGEPSPLELTDVVATDKRLKPVISAAGGHLSWLVDGGVPDIHRTSAKGTQSGPDWMGLIERGDSVVTGVTQSTAWPSFVLLVLATAFLVMAWLREAR